MKKEKRYLVPGDYMADPAVHVFNDRLYKAYTSVPDAPKGDGGVAYING